MTALPSVPLARGGQISDATLQRIITVGHDAQVHDTLDTAGAALIMLTAPQLAFELLHRRRAMATIQDLTDLDNVRFLPGA
ncbi:MAG: hypothetical protein CML69_00930 [Rhodobacteraceae bacterium]|nr:hypothetical protein [Paracoccaceae bacterium]